MDYVTIPSLAESPPAPAQARILYPTNAVPKAGASEPMPPASSLSMSFVLLLVLCAGGYWLLRRRGGFRAGRADERKLVVSESRSLGNRQFLVVVQYENERVLLGVTPGKIDYLCPLPVLHAAAPVDFEEVLS